MHRIDLPDHDVVGIRADNPGPLTLEGTNSWLVGRGPTWLIDPGPDLPEHLDALSAEVDARGGLGAILLTHDHSDHAGAVAELARRFSPVPLAAARGTLPALTLTDGDRLGPLEVFATPGHSHDHLAYVTADGVAFTGDAVLGEGSALVTGELAACLHALTELRHASPQLLAPGHGPPVIDADAKLVEYIEHRLDRERRLRDALAAGLRTADELLDAVWSDAPAALRPAAAVTLAAHLDKLADEDLLPAGVERPVPPPGWPEA